MPTTDPNALPLAAETLELVSATAVAAESSSLEVAKLLSDLASVVPAANTTGGKPSDVVYENRLAMVRLGIATSLYYALQAKHPPTASHSLRVAMSCAAWGERLGLPDDDRDRLEVAALLHDIGKIGIPDQILRKPGKLSREEQLTMAMAPTFAVEIIRGCCDDPMLLEIVRHGSAWYATERAQELVGEEIPLGSRMLAIADAFDAMITEQVHSRAMSRDVAIGQLLDGSGTQFDPLLTHDFCAMMTGESDRVHRQALLKWLRPVQALSPDARWQATADFPSRMFGSGLPSTGRFHEQLLNSMDEGVVFIDRDGIIHGWNHAAELLTGIKSEAVVSSVWSPVLIGLADEEGEVTDAYCPIREAIEKSSPMIGNYTIRRVDGTQVPTRLHVVPVPEEVPGLCGVVLIARDSSHQASLERRVQSLHKQATQDPLTGVANRAEFDRRLNELVDRRAATGATFSLVICDIDHFKSVNDLHGHQAGDEALVKFAAVLRSHSRECDFVARYGGEEFIYLTPDCDLVSAAKRAEAIRATIQQTPLPSLGNASVTASFGVTEVQVGDSADSVLARADRALLQAKESGRNQVIQIGVGSIIDGAEPIKRKRRLLGWFDGHGETSTFKANIITPVPSLFAIEKLRGFIADHKAEIVTVSEGSLVMKMSVRYTVGGRRKADHHFAFGVRILLNETILPLGDGSRSGTQTRTLVKVEITPVRSRDRREKEILACANQIILGLKAYLMGRIENE